MARKYDNEIHALSSKRIARCGHPTKEGRYFKCEKCVPELPTDPGDSLYNGESLNDLTEEDDL